MGDNSFPTPHMGSDSEHEPERILNTISDRWPTLLCVLSPAVAIWCFKGRRSKKCISARERISLPDPCKWPAEALKHELFGIVRSVGASRAAEPSCPPSKQPHHTISLLNLSSSLIRLSCLSPQLVFGNYSRISLLRWLRIKQHWVLEDPWHWWAQSNMVSYKEWEW